MAGKPLVMAAIGSRGSGKSAWVKQLPEVAGARRLIIWDFMREYGTMAQASTSLSGSIKAMSGAAWRIAHQPNPAHKEAEFDLICKAVKAAKRCTLVAEELAFITTPNKAPPAWRELCLLGRHATHAQACIIGVSQRPASIDKDFLAVCDVIHCGRLVNAADAKSVAPFIGCDWRELTGMPDLHYIEKRAGNEKYLRGVLTFDNKRAVTKTSPKGHVLRA